MLDAPVAVHDAAGFLVDGALVVYGGVAGSATPGANARSSAQVYSFADDSWSLVSHLNPLALLQKTQTASDRLASSQSPGVRAHASAWPPLAAHTAHALGGFSSTTALLLFGLERAESPAQRPWVSSQNSFSSGIHAWNLTSGTITPLVTRPPIGSVGAPAPRARHASVYDPDAGDAGVVWLWGGFSTLGPLREFWAFDIASLTWTAMPYPRHPPRVPNPSNSNQPPHVRPGAVGASLALLNFGNNSSRQLLVCGGARGPFSVGTVPFAESCMIFDTNSHKWTVPQRSLQQPSRPMVVSPRAMAPLLPLSSTSVLCFSGAASLSPASLKASNTSTPVADSWLISIEASGHPILYFTPVGASNSSVAGPASPSAPSPESAFFPSPRMQAVAVSDSVGNAIIFGGRTTSNAQPVDSQIYVFSKRSWVPPIGFTPIVASLSKPHSQQPLDPLSSSSTTTTHVSASSSTANLILPTTTLTPVQPQSTFGQLFNSIIIISAIGIILVILGALLVVCMPPYVYGKDRAQSSKKQAPLSPSSEASPSVGQSHSAIHHSLGRVRSRSKGANTSNTVATTRIKDDGDNMIAQDPNILSTKSNVYSNIAMSEVFFEKSIRQHSFQSQRDVVEIESYHWFSRSESQFESQSQTHHSAEENAIHKIDTMLNDVNRISSVSSDMYVGPTLSKEHAWRNSATLPHSASDFDHSAGTNNFMPPSDEYAISGTFISTNMVIDSISMQSKSSHDTSIATPHIGTNTLVNAATSTTGLNARASTKSLVSSSPASLSSMHPSASSRASSQLEASFTQRLNHYVNGVGMFVWNPISQAIQSVLSEHADDGALSSGIQHATALQTHHARLNGSNHGNAISHDPSRSHNRVDVDHMQTDMNIAASSTEHRREHRVFHGDSHQPNNSLGLANAACTTTSTAIFSTDTATPQSLSNLARDDAFITPPYSQRHHDTRNYNRLSVRLSFGRILDLPPD